MTTRKLLGGSEVTELPSPIMLEVYTKCPEKYKLVDMETGEEYVGYASKGKNSWRKLGTDE